MKAKLIFLALLFPVSAVITILLVHYLGYQNLSASLTVDITYIFTISIAIWVVNYKFNFSRWKIGIKEFCFAFLLALILFASFYIEKVILGNYTKGKFTSFLIISSVLFAPVLEEFFSKAILMMNLRKVISSPILNILIIALYFWVWHFPTFLITHFIFGLTTAAFYYYKRNLLQVIFIHSFYNGLIVLFNNFYI